MLRTLLALLLRPPLVGLSWLVTAWLRWRVGARGMLELRLDDQLKPPHLAAYEVERACRASGARGLILELGPLGWGWGALDEWRMMLLRLRQDGLLLIAKADGLDNRQLYLASACDRVVVSPPAEVSAVGVSSHSTFFGVALERLGLRFDVEAAGAYKSFGETFTRRGPSAESREATARLVDDLHEHFVARVAEGRRLHPDQVQAILDHAPMSAPEAKDAGLIDEVGYDDALDPLLESLLGEDFDRKDAGWAAWLSGWAKTLGEVLSSEPRVVVLHLEGGITMGEESQSRGRIAPTELVPILRALRDDDRVAAVVMCVNSPGGSALASDLIWREVELLHRQRPVIALFGDVSASGGYYIAAGCDDIIATPGTLTGSIGVVGGKLVTGAALGGLGVYTSVYSRSQGAELYGTERPFDERERARFRARLSATYALFLERVSAGRRRPVEQLEPYAQGRVWSGVSALRLGLVDGLGGIVQAMERARFRAGLRPTEPVRRVDVVVRPPRPFYARFLPEGILGRADATQQLVALAALIGVRLPEAALRMLRAPDEPLAVMPEEIELR
ncbi:MAG: hypothetical protein RIT28_4483 [Pseudomonadota bacterium]|jgi:protease-4